MRTKKEKLLVLALTLATVIYAEDKVENVMGTVRAVSGNSITIETMGKAPKMVAVSVSPSTKFIRDGAQASVMELKPENRVVVSGKWKSGKFEADEVVFRQIFQHMDMHRK